MFSLLQRDKKPELALTISNRTVIRVLLLVIGSIIFLAALQKMTHALVLIFTAFFLTLALNAPVHWMAQHIPGKKRGSRSIATAVSFLIVIVLLAAFFASIGPPLVRQTNSFIASAPKFLHQVRDQNGGLGKFVHKYKLESQVNNVSNEVTNRLKHASSEAVSTASQIGSSVISLLTILVLTFMMLIEGPHWVKVFTEILPEEKQPYAKRLGRDMYHVIKGYVNGQVLLAAIASAFIIPMLFIMHISYPVALMVVVFICGLIPMVGHTIGAIIVTTVAAFHSPSAAVIILAYYILYQQIENYLIQPRIQANSTNMSPLLVFLAVVLGIGFGGLLGGLVAIPVMGCLRVIVRDQLIRRHMLPRAQAPVHTATNETK